MHKILLVDDNAVVRRLLQDLLTMESYDVVAVASGREAIEALTTFAVDAVVTDLYMPDMDGLELIVEMRKLYPGLKIIAISGGSSRLGARQADHLGTARAIGADAVLKKPFEPDELISALRQLLNLEPLSNPIHGFLPPQGEG
jgi:CheY-like chemotaxis protein